MVRIGTQFHSHSAKEKQEYVDDILSSKFVLCPRGWSPATYRLFEVMELGRCPVIISDDWVPIDGVPWQECCIVIKEKDIAYCARSLQNRNAMPRDLGRRLGRSGNYIFQKRGNFAQCCDSIIELRDKRGSRLSRLPGAMVIMAV